MGNSTQVNQPCINNQQTNQLLSKLSINWQIIQKQQQNSLQILQSRKTLLIIQRYKYQIDSYQQYNQDTKQYDWRNSNPNSELMVNTLSVNQQKIKQKDICGSAGLCPSSKTITQINVVTQRILRITQMMQLKEFQQNFRNWEKVHQQTGDISRFIIPQKFQKIQSFLKFNLDQKQANSILKDWIRGIQVLCYKFGYFQVQKNLLGFNIHKKGKVWINKNFSINQIDYKLKKKVTSAEQKYQYQKHTIFKIIEFVKNINSFEKIVNHVKLQRIQNFDAFVLILDNLSKQKIKAQNKLANMSMCVQQQSSFVSNRNQQIQGLKSQLRNKRLTEQIPKLLLSSRQSKSLQKSPKLIGLNSDRRDNYNNLILGQIYEDPRVNIIKVVSPQIRNQQFILSNHKNCGKQTAPTNQLGHSSSINSNQHSNHLKLPINSCQFVYGRQLSRSQNANLTSFMLKNPKEYPLYQPNRQNIYYPHLKHPQSHMFLSHNYSNQSSDSLFKYHNMSYDQANIVGPYQKGRFYKELNKEKIALVDSMVMVQEQSQEFDDDLNNSHLNILMEQSIIIRGANDKQSFIHNQTLQY